MATTDSAKKRKRVEVLSAVAVEGLDPAHEHAGDMGIYAPVEGQLVNERPLWALLSHREAFLYYSDMGSWCISDAEDMAAGANQGPHDPNPAVPLDAFSG